MKNNGICVLLGLLMLAGGCKTDKKYQQAEGKIYGTYYHVSYASGEDLQQEIHQQMELVNNSLSMFNPESVIAKLNRNESNRTDALFRKMYAMALLINQRTEGAFDITVGPLVNAWGFGFKQDAFPDSARIDSIRQWVGMDKLTLENDQLLKKFPEVVMDASSIAKGLGVDLVAEYFETKGIPDYMVEIGGEIRAKGNNSKGHPWRIGIDRPEDDVTAGKRELQMIVGLSAGALATSGNYRNFYVHDGKKYAHTINPKTGYPVQTEIVSSSVYAATCMEADAYATAFMVMGSQKSKEIVLANPSLEVALIYLEDGKLNTWISPGFEKIIVEK